MPAASIRNATSSSSFLATAGEFELGWVLPFVNRIDQMQSDFADVIKMPTLQHRASDYMRMHVWHGMIDESARDIIIRIVSICGPVPSE